MKYLLAISFLMVLAIPRWAHAQAGLPGVPVCKTTSVTSASTPVQLLAPGTFHWFCMKNRQASTVSVLAFPYTGALPGSAPTNLMELGFGAGTPYFCDTVACPAAGCLNGMGFGWAGVLASGVTAMTVDVCRR